MPDKVPTEMALMEKRKDRTPLLQPTAMHTATLEAIPQESVSHMVSQEARPTTYFPPTQTLVDGVMRAAIQTSDSEQTRRLRSSESRRVDRLGTSALMSERSMHRPTPASTKTPQESARRPT